MKIQITDLTLEQLTQWCVQNNEKPFRAKQIFKWLYQKRVDSFYEMSDISKATQQKLDEAFELRTLRKHLKQVSKDKTEKYLFQTSDGFYIESVLMTQDYGLSICVTSQIGCNMGCRFCASGLLKKKRNLRTSEIVEQVLQVQNEHEERISNIVVMGIGEPFDNYENVMDFVSIVNHDLGLGIGARKITISTCGLADRIKDFADAQTQVNLAISLHAPNDQLRSDIMPINQAYPLDDLFESLRYYLQKNNRRLTFEYILLKGINDTKEHAYQLVDLIKGMNAYVNLIPYNPVSEHGYQPSDLKTSLAFYDILMKNKIQCTLRKEQGQDIDAACGQLRAKHEERA